MIDTVTSGLTRKVKDKKLVDNLFESFQKISEGYVSKDEIKNWVSESRIQDKVILRLGYRETETER